MVEKVRSKFLGLIAFFWLKVTVRTEVKCAAIVLHKKGKQENVNDAPSHNGVQMSLRSQRVRSGACKLDDGTKIAEEREVNGNEHPVALVVIVANAFCRQSGQLPVFSEAATHKDAITLERKRRRIHGLHSLPITNTSSATSYEFFPSSFIIFRTSAPQEKRRKIHTIFHLQPAMKLTRLLSDTLVNDSRIILLSGHVSVTNRYTDTELVAELLHQRDRSVSQHFCVHPFAFQSFCFPVRH